ncbi:hypothetical protein HDU76_013888 [Blyttiomyces sp. JEL0837]|nr:hypothetical protein HDU76_013888 [Blyttiomyces sp. JEL0837]
MAIIAAWDRTNFGLLVAGFAIAYILKYTTILASRKTVRGTDLLAAIALTLWATYIVVQLISLWCGRIYSGALDNYVWVLDTVTIFYNTTLCAIVYISVVRVIALFGLITWKKRAAEIVGYVFIGAIFIIRGVSTSNATPALQQTATNLQIATLLPALCVRMTLDALSMYKLWDQAAKYCETGGLESFKNIVISLILEMIFSILAILVAWQEAVNYTGNKLSFMDWALFSWCIGSWIEQRRLYQNIFKERNSSRASSDTESGTSTRNASFSAASGVKRTKSLSAPNTTGSNIKRSANDISTMPN